MSIEIQDVSKAFGSFQALSGINLTVESGELVALLGPSGSGKTTLLRIIAGLEFATQGTILFDGADASRRDARSRNVGFVFQHYALFRHMTIFENVAFGLRVRPRGTRPSNDVIKARVHELLSLVQLDGLAARFPSQLSGGQRQRVAIARALMPGPEILLLDEPTSALDVSVQAEILNLLRDLQEERGLTYLLVSHNLAVVAHLCPLIGVMQQGRLVEELTAEALREGRTVHPHTTQLRALSE